MAGSAECATGQREMDATAIRDYFAPLQKWLDEQNAGKPVGENFGVQGLITYSMRRLLRLFCSC